MEFLDMNFLNSCFNTIAIIITALFVASEVLAEIPWLKSNSVFQLIRNIIVKFYSLIGKKKEAVEENKQEEQKGE